MPESNKCSRCGAGLPPDAPGGHCISCLLQLGLEASETAIGTPESSAATLPSEKPGGRIGRYKLLQKIGEGGCGIVYMAEQEEPVRRRVALKVIKLGMDTKEVITRFEAERQALALMDHPHIAKVLDGGATLAGRPYFVMELVRGKPITRFCDENCLPTSQRLELFIQVCQAIQHAHQKGVIHRDIKPSNILVADHDGTPVPKVIDFGIAKATAGQTLTDKTLFTAFEQFIGTPTYMSPEQAKLSGLDVDTRSDIYSLGVLLYELLTGRTPFDTKRLMQGGLDEIRRIIQEEDPPRPSTRLSTLEAKEQTSIAHQRQSELSKLLGGLRGDLDWIIMKALDKDRARRYDTAAGLARDIQRHLDCEPILARPPSPLYEFQKMVRRHKVVFAAVAAVMTALILGMVMTGIEARRARQAEREQGRLRAAEQQARQTAEKNERVARQRAYAAGMNLLARALDDKQFSVAADLLNRQRPQPGQEDLRGWEWRYAWQQTRSDATCELCKRPDAISSLALSSDGKWLAVGEHSQGGVSIWDLSRRQEVTEWKAGEGEAFCAFCPTEPTLVFTVATRTSPTNWSSGLRLWDSATRQQLGREIPLSACCRALAFSGDGRTLAAATVDNRITLFRFPEMTVLTTFPAHLFGLDPPMAFALSSDARLAAFAAPGGRLTLMDLQSGRERWTAQTPDEFLWATAISADGNIIASHGDDVRLWDAATGAQIGREDGWGFGMAFSKSGSTMAVSWGESLRFWDISDRAHWRAKTRALRGVKAEIWTLILLPDESTVVTGSRDGAVTLWEAAAVSEAPDAGTLPAEVRAWRFSHDSGAILTLDKQGEVARWQGRGFQHKQEIFSVGTNIYRAKFSEDAGFLAVAPTNGLIEVWDVARASVIGQVFCTIAEFDPTTPALLFLAGGKRLLVLDRFENVHEWDFRTARETASWYLGASWTVALTPDERSCLSVGQVGSQWVASLKHWPDGTQTNKALNLTYIEEAGFSPDGRLFAAASSAIGVGLWDAATLEEAVPLEVSTSESRFSVGFSPDGSRLVVGGGWTHAVQLFDVASGQLVFNIGCLGSMFWPTRFSPDGNVLASMNHQGVLYFWRAPTFDEIKAQDKAAQPQ